MAKGRSGNGTVVALKRRNLPKFCKDQALAKYGELQRQGLKHPQILSRIHSHVQQSNMELSHRAKTAIRNAPVPVNLK